MNEIKQMLDFVNNNVKSDLIERMEQYAKAEKTSARVLCIKLLGWLKERSSLERPFKLNVKHNGWYRALQSAIQDNKQLNSIFECSEKGIDLRSTVNMDDVNALVSSNYNPRVFHKGS